MGHCFKAVIVDDEQMARTQLCRMLNNFEEVEVVKECENIESAVDAINLHNPDVIFLDVQMPDGCGFELFERTKVTADVICLSDLSESAVRAFEFNALDYLLKPVDPRRLAVSMDRFLRKIDAVADAVANADSTATAGDFKHEERIAIRENAGLRYVPMKEVAFLSGADDYAEVHLRDGRRFLSDERLVRWEERLAPHGFLRIHRQSLINIDAIEKLVRRDGSYWITLHGAKETLPVARRRTREVREKLRLCRSQGEGYQSQ